MLSTSVSIKLANSPDISIQIILIGDAHKPVYCCEYDGISYKSSNIDPNGVFRYGSVFKHPEDYHFDYTQGSNLVLVLNDSFLAAKLCFEIDPTNQGLNSSLSGRIKRLEETNQELMNQMITMKQIIDSYYGFENVDRVPIGNFAFNSTNVETFDIPPSSECKQWFIHYFLRCGTEAPSREFFVKIWTTVNGKDYVQYVSGQRYGQNAISFDSGNLWFPAGTDNKIRVQCDDVQLTNCHLIKFYLVGFR